MEVNLEGLGFRLTVQDYQITGGFEAKCLLDDSTRPDWARITMTEELAEFFAGKEVGICVLEAGNEEGYELLLKGNGNFTAEGIMQVTSKDPGLTIGRIVATFVDCTLQEAAKYILAISGIEDYRLTEKDYGRKQYFMIDAMSCGDALDTLDAIFGAGIDYYSRDGVLYYGVEQDQNEYITLTDDNILEIEKSGDTWMAEIIPVPHIHARQLINVECEEFRGMGRVTKCVIEGGESLDMYINFKEEEDG